jgi:hypothetical protein
MERRASLAVILLRILAVLSFFAIPTSIARLHLYMPARGVFGLAVFSLAGLLTLAQLVKRNQESIDDQLDYDAKAKATGDRFAGDREMTRYENQAASKLRRPK